MKEFGPGGPPCQNTAGGSLMSQTKLFPCECVQLLTSRSSVALRGWIWNFKFFVSEILVDFFAFEGYIIQQVHQYLSKKLDNPYICLCGGEYDQYRK